ncbi:MAG: hypothetical protein WD738_22650 [Pirellulales bacterium]
MKLRTRSAAGWFGAAVAYGLLALAGCDLGMEQSSNRYEQLNIETKKLTDILEQVTDEASAKAHQTEMQEAGDKMRDVQKRIADAEEKRAKNGGGGMGNITNFRQASLFQQTGDAARRQTERIRETDAKAGDIVDKALEGVELPPPPLEVPGEPAEY